MAYVEWVVATEATEAVEKTASVLDGLDGRLFTFGWSPAHMAAPKPCRIQVLPWDKVVNLEELLSPEDVYVVTDGPMSTIRNSGEYLFKDTKKYYDSLKVTERPAGVVSFGNERSLKIEAKRYGGINHRHLYLSSRGEPVSLNKLICEMCNWPYLG